MKLSRGQKRELSQIIIGAALYATAVAVMYIFELPKIYGLAVFAPSYLILAMPILIKAVKNLININMLDENFLMTIASVGAFALLECSEGVAVMLFDRVGEFFEDYAVAKSRKDISSLIDLCPDYANVVRDGGLIEVLPDEVAIGETIVVMPGEKVPLDGRIISGDTSFDTSGLTGESAPRDAHPGDGAVSGYINLSGKIEIITEKEYSESTVSKILELIETATDKKSKSENFITRFARVYTPIVVGAAIALALIPSLLHFAVPEIITGGFDTWIYRALLFLVVSCPCALVVSVPLSFFSGIGGASRSGVLIKGSNYIELLSKADLFVFDKTGTLTKGTFSVSGVISDDPEKTVYAAACAEQYSLHPIARAIKEKAGRVLPECEVHEIAGKGVCAEFDGHTVYAGNARLMEENGIALCEQDTAGTVVYVSYDGGYLGAIIISDEIKDDSVDTIKELNSFADTVMLSGDNYMSVKNASQALGVKKAIGNLLPQDKVTEFERLKKDRVAVFTGDGINDAPVLAMADVGVAMGALGSDAAIEAADVVILNDAPSKLLTARRFAKKTMNIVYQNIVFALVIKIGIMLLGAVGLANMWAAVFADVGVLILAVGNAVRASKI